MSTRSSKKQFSVGTYVLQNPALVLGFAFMIALLASRVVTTYMACASFSYMLMIYGLFSRKNRTRHALLMGTAIGIDLALVLVLEFQRSAIKTALSFSLTPLQQAHIGVSSLAAVFFMPVVALGIAQLTSKRFDNPRIRKWHGRFGITAFCLRSVGFLLMFSMLNHVKQ